jgi:hypothetical protein
MIAGRLIFRSVRDGSRRKENLAGHDSVNWNRLTGWLRHLDHLRPGA